MAGPTPMYPIPRVGGLVRPARMVRLARAIGLSADSVGVENQFEDKLWTTALVDLNARLAEAEFVHDGERGLIDWGDTGEERPLPLGARPVRQRSGGFSGIALTSKGSEHRIADLCPTYCVRWPVKSRVADDAAVRLADDDPHTPAPTPWKRRCSLQVGGEELAMERVGKLGWQRYPLFPRRALPIVDE